MSHSKGLWLEILAAQKQQYVSTFLQDNSGLHIALKLKYSISANTLICWAGADSLNTMFLLYWATSICNSATYKVSETNEFCWKCSMACVENRWKCTILHELDQTKSLQVFFLLGLQTRTRILQSLAVFLDWVLFQMRRQALLGPRYFLQVLELKPLLHLQENAKCH